MIRRPYPIKGQKTMAYEITEHTAWNCGRDFDPTDRQAALTMLEAADAKGEVLTGVLFVNTNKPTFIDLLNMVDEPVGTLPQSRTRPPKAALDEVMEELC